MAQTSGNQGRRQQAPKRLPPTQLQPLKKRENKLQPLKKQGKRGGY